MGETVVNWQRLEREFLGFEPLGSRLRPPHVQVELVPRERLVRRLLATRAQLVLVSAPAGAGKTIALTQWAARDPRPTAWLQLDAADNDPVLFLSYLAAALSSVTPVDPSVFESLRSRPAPLREHILPGLAAALDAAAPFLLLLDDAQLVTEREAWELAGFMLDQLPPGAQAAIASRTHPPLPLARLRAAGRLAEVGMKQLAMDAPEARRLLDINGLLLDDEPLSRLLALTEGWPAGLSLAMLMRHEQRDPDWTSGLRGDQRQIAAYLGAEALDAQPVRLQDFLLRTAILDRLSSGLCRAVTEMDDAHQLLARLAADNVFVVSLDDRQEWYRYHHLFAELLRAELERREPGAAPALHRRAASWLHAHGDADRAVAHAIAAGDGARVADQAALQCDLHLQRGHVGRAVQLWSRFSDEQIRKSPALTLTAMLLSVHSDDPRLRLHADSARRLPVDDAPTPVGASSLRSWQLILRAHVGREGLEQMRRDAEAALELESGDTYRVSALELAAFANYAMGKLVRARELIASVAALGEEGERQWAYAMQSLMAAEQGCWDEAERLEELARLCDCDQFQTAPVLARIRLLGHRRDPRLRAAIDEADAELRLHFPAGQHRRLLALTVFAETCLEAGDPEAAGRWVANAEALIRGYPDAGRLEARARHVRNALEHLRLTDPLTPAEQRVLELLPTHLTATQIAARLFVTRNTVKSHMRRLYLKLGVTSRAGAVERAVELGLARPPAAT